MPDEFSGKTALVTGASRGIGSAAAIGLARAGVRGVVVHYHSYREGAEATLAAVRAAGAEGQMMAANLGTVAGIHSFVTELKTAAPEVDILVNNAGSLVKRPRWWSSPMSCSTRS